MALTENLGHVISKGVGNDYNAYETMKPFIYKCRYENTAALKAYLAADAIEYILTSEAIVGTSTELRGYLPEDNLDYIPDEKFFFLNNAGDMQNLEIDGTIASHYYKRVISPDYSMRYYEDMNSVTATTGSARSNTTLYNEVSFVPSDATSVTDLLGHFVSNALMYSVLPPSAVVKIHYTRDGFNLWFITDSVNKAVAVAGKDPDYVDENDVDISPNVIVRFLSYVEYNGSIYDLNDRISMPLAEFKSMVI